MRYLFILLLVASLCGCSIGANWSAARACKKGQRDAQEAISKGKLAFETFGYPSEWGVEYESALEAQFGIRSISIAGCIVSDYEIQHAKGFNEIMQTEVDRKLGSDVLDAFKKRLRADYETRKAKEDAMPWIEKRIRKAISEIFSDDEQKQIVITADVSGRVKVDGPEDLTQRLSAYLSRHNPAGQEVAPASPMPHSGR